MDFKKSFVCGALTLLCAALVASIPVPTEKPLPTTVSLVSWTDGQKSNPTKTPTAPKTSIGSLKDVLLSTAATRGPTTVSAGASGKSTTAIGTSVSGKVLNARVSPTNVQAPPEDYNPDDEVMSDTIPQEDVKSSAEPHTTARRSAGTQTQVMNLIVKLLALSKNTWDEFSIILTKQNASLNMADFLTDAHVMDRPRFSDDVMRDITTCTNKQGVLDAGWTLMVNYLPWILQLTSVNINDSVAMYLNTVIDAFDALTTPTGAPPSGQLPSTTAPPPRDTPSVLVTLSTLHKHCGTLAEFLGRCVLQQ